MKKTSITISFDEEKLSALKMYLSQRSVQLESELERSLETLYTKTVPAGGNAQRVFDYAENFLKEEANNRLYDSYGKYLVFDCDAPKDISSVISAASACSCNYIHPPTLKHGSISKKLVKRIFFS